MWTVISQGTLPILIKPYVFSTNKTLKQRTKETNILFTHADPWDCLLAEDPEVHGLAEEVLQSGDGVDRVRFAVDTDGANRHRHELHSTAGTPGTPGIGQVVTCQFVLVEGVGRELEGVAGVGEVAIIVDRADGDIQEACV